MARQSDKQRKNDPKSPETQDVDNDYLGVLRSIFSNSTVIAVIFSALLYFWGWRYIFSYYASFGLDPIFFSFSPMDIIFSGWRVYVYVLSLVTVAIFLLTLFRKNVYGRITTKDIKYSLRLFFIIFEISLALIAFEAYQYFYVFGAHSTSRYFFWAFVMLLFLYVSFLIGYGIYQFETTPSMTSSPLLTVFRWLFPSPEIWSVGLLLVFVFVFSAFSSFEGLVYSKRDQGSGSRLQIATVYLNKPLAISGAQPIQLETWVVDDLRILFKTEDMYFFFRTEEVERNDGVPIIYAVPKEAVEQLLLRSWYDKFAHSVEPTLTIVLTPTLLPND